MMRERQYNDDESDKDRLSDLSDCLLLYILSFLNNYKDIIQTCILSTRWKHLWKLCFPALTLHFSKTNCSLYANFDEFVCMILRSRDNSIPLHTFDLERHGIIYHNYDNECINTIRPCILRQITSFILSHTNHLRRLAISLRGDISLVLPCVSACRALTSLKLSLYPEGRCNYDKKILFPKSLNLPALTSLDLTNFYFCANENNEVEPFSAFNLLNSLTICKCAMDGTKTMSISSETLVTLSLVRNCHSFSKVELSTPTLSNITFIGDPCEILRGSTLFSVNQVYIEAHMYTSFGDSLIDWLMKLPNITSLTLTQPTLQMISLALPDVLNKFEFSSLCHLKSLKFKTELFPASEKVLLESFKSWKEEVEDLDDSIEINYHRRMGRVAGFLCQNSPLTKFDLLAI